MSFSVWHSTRIVATLTRIRSFVSRFVASDNAASRMFETAAAPAGDRTDLPMIEPATGC
jgi:hypothetical protein